LQTLHYLALSNANYFFSVFTPAASTNQRDSLFKQSARSALPPISAVCSSTNQRYAH